MAAENTVAAAGTASEKVEKKEYRKVPKSLLWWCWFKFSFLHHVSQAFDRGYMNNYTASIMPILRYLYKGRPDADEQIKAGLLRTRNYHLCEQSFDSVIFGIIIGMEEQKANGAPMSGDVITATRTSLMGPLSGLGDAIHGSTFRQIAIAISIPYCLQGSVWGALLMLVGMNITPWLTTLIGFPKGYEMGGQFVLKLLQTGIMQKAAELAGIMSMFIMGGMTAKYVVIETTLEFSNKYKTVSIQDMFDSAIPGILSIGAVFIYYVLLKKKVSPNKMIVGTMILGILFSVLKVMG